MSWNHRVVRRTGYRVGVCVEWYTIYEIHYWVKEGGEDYPNISGWGRNSAIPSGESLDELRLVLGLIKKCLAKPVLDLATLEGKPRDGKPRWVTLVETIRAVWEDAQPPDYHDETLPRAVQEAISFVATAKSMTDPLEARFQADGSVILEIGDGSRGSIIFKNDEPRIVYTCDDIAGSIVFGSLEIPQVLKEVLTIAAHRSQSGTDPDATTSDHTIRE